MAGPGSTFTGPLISGPKWYADANGSPNTGLVELTQMGTIYSGRHSDGIAYFCVAS